MSQKGIIQIIDPIQKKTIYYEYYDFETIDDIKQNIIKQFEYSDSINFFEMSKKMKGTDKIKDCTFKKLSISTNFFPISKDHPNSNPKLRKVYPTYMPRNRKTIPKTMSPLGKSENDIANLMKNLREICPKCTDQQLRNALTKYNYNIEESAEHLLNLK